MSNSLLDLTSTQDLFSYVPDWSESFNRSQGLGRSIIQYNRGVNYNRTLTNDISYNIEMSFLNMSKSDEYLISSFFCSHRGRCNRFWLPLWKQYFSLSSPIVNGSFTFNIEDNGFSSIYQGYERLFIKTSSGDLLTRKITGPNSDTQWIVKSAFDRDLALSEISYCSKALLVRFDQDELEMEQLSRDVSSCQLRFQELAKEYDLAGGGS